MQNEMEEKFEDWRGKEAIPGKHGGIRAASIACGKFLYLNKNTLINCTFIIYKSFDVC